MYHIKNDQRAIRSSQILYDALASLMREKPYDTIRVTDLVEEAQVGRTTFYRNFDAIEDVLRMRCDQVFDGLIAYVKSYLQQHPHEVNMMQIKPTLRYFYLHSDIVELLMQAKRIDIIHDAFHRCMEPFKEQIIAHQGVSEAYVDYALAIRVGVTVNVLIHWIETDKQQAPDDLANTLRMMMSKVMTMGQLM